MKRSNKITFAIFIVVLVGAACHLPHEPGPQPSTIIETDFVPGLNILGVLRLDDQPGTSFIHIEQACRTEEIYDEDFTLIIEDAGAVVRGATDKITYPFIFKADTLRPDTYTHPDFIPTFGEQYALSITHPELPTLTDTTIVPVKPYIDYISLDTTGQTLSFVLLTTTDTYLYDIYLISSSDSLHYRFANQGEGLLPITFNPTAGPGQTMTIHIHGYDTNLAEYLTAATTIKYQTYQETVTTVTGGYGVFGSVSVSKFTLTR